MHHAGKTHQKIGEGSIGTAMPKSIQTRVVRRDDNEYNSITQIFIYVYTRSLTVVPQGTRLHVLCDASVHVYVM